MDELSDKAKQRIAEREELMKRPVQIGTIFSGNSYFNWGWPGVGFGQLSFSVEPRTMKFTCMNECMSRDMVRKILVAYANHIANHCILEDNPEDVPHNGEVIPDDLNPAIKKIVDAAITWTYCPDAGGYRDGSSIEDTCEDLAQAVTEYTGVDPDRVTKDWLTEEEMLSAIKELM